MSDYIKQFIGLYAVGHDNTASTLSGVTPSTPVFVKALAGKIEAFPVDPVVMPLPMMVGMKPGLYVGVVNIGAVSEVKIIPLKLTNQKMFEEVIDPTLRVDCVKAIDDIFGDNTDDGEATPAYVNQS